MSSRVHLWLNYFRWFSELYKSQFRLYGSAVSVRFPLWKHRLNFKHRISRFRSVWASAESFAILLVISFFLKRPKTKFPFYAFGVIFVLLLLETFWLLPVLDARATEVINGTAAPMSNSHFIYIAFDAVKFLLLFALGVSLTKQNLKFDWNEKRHRNPLGYW